MKDIQKVDTVQLYTLWKNLSIAIMVLVGVMAFSKILPAFCSPIVSLIGVAILYTIIYNNRHAGDNKACMIIPYSIFIALISYSFIAILMNLANIWSFFNIPAEFNFFSAPFIPSLLLAPICFFSVLTVFLLGSRVPLCRDCRLSNGSHYERGKLGSMLRYESHFQLRNMIGIFGILSVVIWTYYLKYYVNIVQNGRDWYIFTWLTVIILLLDEIYFMVRYYNLYLDFKDNDELVSGDLDVTDNTVYMRFYVCCGENVYVTETKPDPSALFEVIDTPFMVRIPVHEHSMSEAKRAIRRLTGVDNGLLRYFYGGKSQDRGRFGIIRYFYFLPGKPEDYPELATHGHWMDYAAMKTVYSHNTRALARISVIDTTRLATIMLTEKTYDENGIRKVRLKHFKPTYTLEDVKNSPIDFSDDKWIRISMFNSDSSMFRIRRFMRNLFRRDRDRGARNNRTWLI